MRKFYILGAVAVVVLASWVGLLYAERSASEDVDAKIRSSFLKDHIDYDGVTVNILSGSLTFENLRAVSQYARFVNILEIGELELSSVTLQGRLPLEAELRASDVVFAPSALRVLGFTSSEVNVLHAVSGRETFAGSFEFRHDLDEDEGALFSALELRIHDVASITSEGKILGVDREFQTLIANLLQGMDDGALATKGIGQWLGVSLALQANLKKLELSQSVTSLEDLGAFDVLNEVAAYERQLYGEMKARYEAPDLNKVSMGELLTKYRKPGGMLLIEIDPDTPLPLSDNRWASQPIEGGPISVSGL
ncbi:hypothetical protein ACSHT0_17235 [Tepidicaulis sp. LMO-SS28]|uniref:hypothetical protein n=1 Tax=Tepidicaulis sp. LMO-SS28 TaxID=3447455 RepID=UPI003EE052EF